MHIEKSLRRDLLSDPFRPKVMRLRIFFVVFWGKKRRKKKFGVRKIPKHETQLGRELEIEISPQDFFVFFATINKKVFNLQVVDNLTN